MRGVEITDDVDRPRARRGIWSVPVHRHRNARHPAAAARQQLHLDFLGEWELLVEEHELCAHGGERGQS